jgi:hypothetical protein
VQTRRVNNHIFVYRSFNTLEWLLRGPGPTRANGPRQSEIESRDCVERYQTDSSRDLWTVEAQRSWSNNPQNNTGDPPPAPHLILRLRTPYRGGGRSSSIRSTISLNHLTHILSVFHEIFQPQLRVEVETIDCRQNKAHARAAGRMFLPFHSFREAIAIKVPTIIHRPINSDSSAATTLLTHHSCTTAIYVLLADHRFYGQRRR